MKSLYSFGAAHAVWTLLWPSSSFGQALESEIRNFSMPPPSGYLATKTFAYVGDYGYYTAPTSSLPGQTSNPSDYKYVRYLGVDGKHVFVYGAWGPTHIPPATATGDSCFHAHASYGVWGRFDQTFLWGTFSGWKFLGGGGMSGNRNASGQCVFSPNNSLSSTDPRFGWGQSFQTLDFRCPGVIFNFGCGPFYKLTYKELVVGVLSNTHGWGSCSVPPNTFQACFEPSYIIGYTLP